jgi:hypothetical protein
VITQHIKSKKKDLIQSLKEDIDELYMNQEANNEKLVYLYKKKVKQFHSILKDE